ncbi:hypothetical protein C8F04DRAFT_885131, partial [Mycena alexandri]
AKKRPKAVGDWVARARNYTPTVTSGDDLGEQWWIWWTDINPEWRGEERPMRRDAGKPWKSMDYCGQNGFLNVLMVLKWWRDAMEESSPDWEDAVDDVIWVLQQM